jgi:hypothetical protein
MLTGCSAVSEVMCAISPRNGMNSPNGTSCRLTYCGPGPRPGSQSWPTLRTGPSTISPTRIGRLMACSAVSIAW